jgi:hypothetical protein
VSVRRTAARTLGVLALVVPTSATFVLAQPALAADSDFSSPPAGQDFSGAATSVPVTASVPACPKNAFGGCSSTPTTTLTATAGSQSFSATPVKATTRAQSISVTIPAGAANGTWTAQLAGGNTGSRSFTTSFQPATPAGFSAQGSGQHDVLLTWQRGSEPDLLGYALFEDGSGAGQQISFDGAGCTSAGSQCSLSKTYSTDGSSHSYDLVAKRSGASSGSIVRSDPASASVVLAPKPKPTPSPTPAPAPGGTPAPNGSPSPGAGSGGTTGGTTTGGTGSGGTGGSGTGTTGGPGGTTGGSAPGGTATGPDGKPAAAIPTLKPNPLAQRRTFALTFNAFSPSLGIPKLPPLPATTLPSFGGEQPLPLGTFKPSLPYSPQTETTKTTSILSSPTAFVSSIDSAQLAKSLAVALLLLLVGAHLRRFLGAHVED